MNRARRVTHRPRAWPLWGRARSVDNPGSTNNNDEESLMQNQ
jgi:hypothetical protein